MTFNDERFVIDKNDKYPKTIEKSQIDKFLEQFKPEEDYPHKSTDALKEKLKTIQKKT